MVSVNLLSRSSPIIAEEEFSTEGAEKKSPLRILSCYGLFYPFLSALSVLKSWHSSRG
jgi:hypothetical protein